MAGPTCPAAERQATSTAGGISVSEPHDKRDADDSVVAVLPATPLDSRGERPQLAVKSNDRAIIRLGLWVLLLAFGVFGTWAAVAQLDGATVAHGLVTVESYRKTVQHLEGGIVREIRVRDGDRVQEGDTLLLLEDTRPRAEMEVTRTRYYAALAHEARLVAERDGLDAIRFPAELEDAAQSDPRAAEAIRVQRQTFEARRATHRGEVALLEQRVEQLNSKIEGLSALLASQEQLESSLAEEAADFRRLFEKGLGDKQRVRQLEREAAEARGEAGEHRASIASTRLQIGETRQQILQLEKERHSQIVQEHKDVQEEVFNLREGLLALEDTVERTVVRAPASGTVMGLGVHTIGGVIKAGTPILDIVPQGEPLVVEAQVSPIDIDKVEPGLPTDIRFSAFASRYTPVVEGRVLTVSADRFEDSDSGSGYYLARVQVLPEGMDKLRGLTLYPGMPAEVLIKTGERTLLSYLVQPMSNAFARAFREE